MDYTNIHDELISKILIAGKLVKKLMKKELFFEEKGAFNYLSHIDLAVQDFLINSLKNILPEAQIISEEIDNNKIKNNELNWIIDPIDGTTNLIHNYPHFSTSVALINNGKPIISVTYNPITKELFHAVKDKGAFLNKKRIFVSQNKSLQNSLLGFGFPYDRDKTHFISTFINKAISKVQDLRRTGSSTLDLAYIASGRIDGYFELDLELWDYSAGSLLITEAGGVISTLDLQSLNYFGKSNIIASNGFIHSELANILNN